MNAAAPQMAAAIRADASKGSHDWIRARQGFRGSEPDAAWSRRRALLGARWSMPPLTLMKRGYGGPRHDGNEVISQCGRPTECVPGGGGPQGTLLDNRRTASDRTLDRDCCPTDWSRSAISEGKRCAPCNRATSSFSSAIMRSTAARLRRITWPRRTETGKGG